MRGCGSDVHAYLGVRYIDLFERLKTRFTGTWAADSLGPAQINQSQRSEFDGTGPEVGLGGQFCVWGDFGISGELGMMALIGTRKNRVRTIVEIFESGSTSVERQEFQYDNCLAVIPGINFRTAVNWTMECSCIKGGVELGYKLDHYFNALYSAINAVNTTKLRGIGFAGPFVGFSLTY